MGGLASRRGKVAPNVLRFSCRRGALHQITSKKVRSRAPKAVSCKRLLAGTPAKMLQSQAIHAALVVY